MMVLSFSSSVSSRLDRSDDFRILPREICVSFWIEGRSVKINRSRSEDCPAYALAYTKHTYNYILLDLFPRFVSGVGGDRHPGNDNGGVLLNQVIIGCVGCGEDGLRLAGRRSKSASNATRAGLLTFFCLSIGDLQIEIVAFADLLLVEYLLLKFADGDVQAIEGYFITF